MKHIIISYKLEIIGTVLGLIIGYCYWYFVGCKSGTCAITSSPINSALYGATMGVLILNIFKKDKKQKKSNQINNNNNNNDNNT